MAEEKVLGNPATEAAGKKGAAKSAKKRAPRKAARKARGVKKPRKIAKKAAPPLKAAKKRGRKAGRRGRKPAVRITAKGMGSGSAPTIFLLGKEGKVEPVWFRYAQMAPAKHSSRPSVPTDIRVGNLVGWKTESGKDRIGIVQEFILDSAVVGMGGRSETIRIARLTKLAEKVKES